MERHWRRVPRPRNQALNEVATLAVVHLSIFPGAVTGAGNFLYKYLNYHNPKQRLVDLTYHLKTGIVLLG